VGRGDALVAVAEEGGAGADHGAGAAGGGEDGGGGSDVDGAGGRDEGLGLLGEGVEGIELLAGGGSFGFGNGEVREGDPERGGTGGGNAGEEIGGFGGDGATASEAGVELEVDGDGDAVALGEGDEVGEMVLIVEGEVELAGDKGAVEILGAVDGVDRHEDED